MDNIENDGTIQETPVVLLCINLAPGVAAALQGTAEDKGLSITEAVRHAIALWKMVTDEQRVGRRVMVVDGERENASFREIVLDGTVQS